MYRIALLLVVVSACKKSEPTQAGAGSGSAAASGSAAGSAADVTAKPAETPPAKAKSYPLIECAKVIPQPIVDKYFKDLKTSSTEPYAGDDGSTTTCRFILDEKTNRKILIDYHCGPDFANLDEYLGLLQKQINAKFERVPGVGRGGYRIGTSTVGAQHRSLPCVINVDLSFLDNADPERTKDYMPLVKDLEAALPD